MTIYKTMIAEDLNNPRKNCISWKDCFSELFSGMTVFLLLIYLFVRFGSAFPLFDLSFVNQLGVTLYWRHVRTSIYNHEIKGFNPNYIYHHCDITLKIVIGSTSKEKYRKIMTIKIWLWNLDKCSRLIKSCLHA